jgi:hypothetical protein
MPRQVIWWLHCSNPWCSEAPLFLTQINWWNVFSPKVVYNSSPQSYANEHTRYTMCITRGGEAMLNKQ